MAATATAPNRRNIRPSATECAYPCHRDRVHGPLLRRSHRYTPPAERVMFSPPPRQTIPKRQQPARPAPCPNRLVHEYSEQPNLMLPTLKRARGFVDTLCADTQTPDLPPCTAGNECHDQNA